MTIKEANLALANRYLKFIGFNRDQKMRNMCLTLIEHIESGDGLISGLEEKEKVTDILKSYY